MPGPGSVRVVGKARGGTGKKAKNDGQEGPLIPGSSPAPPPSNREGMAFIAGQQRRSGKGSGG